MHILNNEHILKDFKTHVGCFHTLISWQKISLKNIIIIIIIIINIINIILNVHKEEVYCLLSGSIGRLNKTCWVTYRQPILTLFHYFGISPFKWRNLFLTGCATSFVEGFAKPPYRKGLLNFPSIKITPRTLSAWNKIYYYYYFY